MHVLDKTTKGKEEERQMFQQMQAMAQKQVTISFSSFAPISFLRNWKKKKKLQKKKKYQDERKKEKT